MPNLTVNGVQFAYPDIGSSNWGAAATGWASAVTSGMLSKSGGTFTLTSDANFGANFGLISKYFKSNSSLPAASGSVRLANADSIAWRNNGNSADMILAKNASDQLTYAGNAFLSASGVVLAGGLPAFTGDVTTVAGNTVTTVAKIAGVAVGTPTGTGNVVMSNSPAITGLPTIGTSGSASPINTPNLTITGNHPLGLFPTATGNALGIYTPDFNNSSAGSAMTIGFSGTSGNVTSKINAWTSGTAGTGTLALQSDTGGPITFGGLLTGASFVSSTASPAGTGIFRLGSADAVSWRNNGNSADVALSKNTSDQLAWAGTAFLSASTVLLAAAFPALTGDVTTVAGALASTLAGTISGAKVFSTSLTSPFFISNTANAAGTGILRLASADAIKWRNNANGADIALAKDTSDQLSWAGTSFLSASARLLAAGMPALTGDVTTAGGAFATTLAATTNATLTTLSALVSVATITTGVWNAGALTSSGIIKTSLTTDSSNTTSGALQTAGGLGVAKAINVGGTVTGTTAIFNGPGAALGLFTSSEVLDATQTVTSNVSSTTLGIFNNQSLNNALSASCRAATMKLQRSITTSQTDTPGFSGCPAVLIGYDFSVASGQTLTTSADMNRSYVGVLITGPSAQSGTLALGTTAMMAIQANATATGTTKYGIYLDAQTGASTNYGMYVVSTQSFFGGNVGFNASSPGRAIEVDSGGASTPAIKFTSSHSTAANGAIASVLTANSGPTGAATAVQGWLLIDVGGTTHYMPYW